MHLEQGQAEAALKHYDAVFPKAMALVPKGDIVAELRRRRAECFYLLARHDEAYAEAKLGLTHCRELGDRYEEAATYRVLALAAAAVGRPGEAKQHFEQGFAFYEDIETPYEWGKLWMAYGDWLRGPHAGAFADTRGALEAYLLARDLFERMGAKAKLAETQARFAELNVAHSGGTPPSSVPASFVTTDAPVRRPVARRSTAEIEARTRWAYETFGLLTRRPGMLELLGTVEKLARSRSPILVLGESGTGKELVAAGIHRLSGRSGAYFPINCGAMSREMIESELFGHVSGSFTGATRDKPGLVEVCDGGTVFLDEIGEMPIDLQTKLLRFLESGESRRVGSVKLLHVDARIVAATNRTRDELQGGGPFREDLFYRLAHGVVTLPPLRERGDDVVLLAQQFLARACERERRRLEFTSAALGQIERYRWPGNVRELKAVVEQAALVAEGEWIEHLSLSGSDDDASDFGTEMLGVEKRRIEEALATHRGSRAEAARALRMPRTTLLAKMRRYGLR